MAITIATLALSTILGWASTGTTAEADLPPARADLEPKRFRLRTGSFEIGVAWRPEYSVEGVCGFNPICGFTPRVGFDLELGSRTVRLVVGSFTAPVPTFTYDLVSLEAFMLETGVLFGGPKIRGGLMLNGGAINAGAAAVLRLSPWVDPRGHRHGLDLRFGTSIFQQFVVAVTYRFYPRRIERKYPRH